MAATTSADVTAIEAPLGVLQDSGSKIVLTICVPGLKRRQGVLNTLKNAICKVKNPFRLASNAKFGAYSLTDSSLDFSVDVYENKAALKKPPGDAIKQRYVCRISKFPTRINADSAQFELTEAAGGDCYFVLQCVKTDNYSTNWKEFLASNGTLDAGKL